MLLKTMTSHQGDNFVNKMASYCLTVNRLQVRKRYFTFTELLNGLAVECIRDNGSVLSCTKAAVAYGGPTSG